MSSAVAPQFVEVSRDDGRTIGIAIHEGEQRRGLRASLVAPEPEVGAQHTDRTERRERFNFNERARLAAGDRNVVNPGAVQRPAA